MNTLEAKDKLMSIKQAAEFLGISVVTLHRKKKEKTIGFYQVGNRILFSMEKHILSYLKKNEQLPEMEVKGNV